MNKHSSLVKNFISFFVGNIFFLQFLCAQPSVNTLPAAKTDLSWTPSRAWTPSDEQGFSNFIVKLGEARKNKICNTVDNCLKNPNSNLFSALNPKGINFYSDCADFPFVLRAYYAWINNLEFSYPTGLTNYSAQDDGGDPRYNRKGNVITTRRFVKNGDRFDAIVRDISNQISSATYRIHPRFDDMSNIARDDGSIIPRSGYFTDFYSPKISREAITPGTVVYDPNGHVLLVYKVSDNGRIYMIDAHPDNSMTKKTYGADFMRSSPSAGAGFKKWRPVSLNLSTTGKTPVYKPTFPLNAQLSDFSLEQFYGNKPIQFPSSPTQAMKDAAWSKGLFAFNDQVYLYYDYVRQVLSTSSLIYNPITEVKDTLEDICSDAQDRMQAVFNGKKALSTQAHPLTLPVNIYGTSGDWESFATPSRDARFRTTIKDLFEKILMWVNLYKSGNYQDKMVYEGTDLVSDLKSLYEQSTKKCAISYRNTSGNAVALNLFKVIEERIFDLSFDPYHCVELRWGAMSSDELASCPQAGAVNKTKFAWYRAEERLRWQVERNYDQKMNLTLEQLKANPLGPSSQPILQWKQLEKLLAQ